MANHKSALKRVRSSEKRRLHNRFYAKSMRTSLRNFYEMEDKEKAAERAKNISSMIDKLAKRHVIHKNKAANLKSKMFKHLNKM